MTIGTREINMKEIFSPNCIAVVGASERRGSVGNAIFTNIVSGGFCGDVFPVNPKSKFVEGHRCYEKITDIDDTVDVAVIAVPAKAVGLVLEQCFEKSVSGIVLISAGFGETGEEGRKNQERLAALAREHQIPIIGPNCLGFVNNEVDLNATFAGRVPKKGHISLVSQSGAIGVFAFEYMAQNDWGLDKFISLGNKMMFSENEAFQYLAYEESTKVVLTYLEDWSNPAQLLKDVRVLIGEQNKPLIMVKSGSSESGQRAAKSHTGTLAARADVFDDLLEQAGIIRAKGLRQLLDYANLFLKQRPAVGSRVGVITNAGGLGIVVTDAAESVGLSVPELSQDLQSELRSCFPPAVSVNNPVDLMGDADQQRYQKALSLLLGSDEVDMVLVVCTPQKNTDMPAIASSVSELVSSWQNNHGKVFAGVFGEFGTASRCDQILQSAQIPNYQFPEAAVDALAASWKFTILRSAFSQSIPIFDVDKERATQLIDKYAKGGESSLVAGKAFELLECYGISIASYKMISQKDHLESVAQGLRFPLAMSVVSSDIIHKTDVGGVVLNLRNKNDLEQAYDDIMRNIGAKCPNAKIDGVLCQAMVTGGAEMIAGVQFDEKFGHLLMFGLGGIFVEVLEDVCFKLIPVTRADVRRMISKLRGYKVLKGVRGNPPSDMEAIENLLLRLSQLVKDFPMIKEVDLNPVMALSTGAQVIDAKIRIKP